MSAKRAQQRRRLVTPRADGCGEVTVRIAQEIAVGGGHPVIAFNGDDHDVGRVAIQAAAGIENFLAECAKSRLIQTDIEPTREPPCYEMVVQEFRREARCKCDTNGL